MINRITRYFNGEFYQARAFRGALFSVFGLAIENFLRLASNLVLTRLLFPEAFGLMALVNVVLVASSMISDLGLKGAVFKDARGDERAFLDTIWTLQIIRGFILGAAIYLSAGPLSIFYDAPILADLLKFAALFPVIQGFGSTQLLSLSRHIQIGRLVALNIAGQIIEISVMIALAIYTESVWALLVGGAVGVVVRVILSHTLLGGMQNRVTWDTEAVRSVLKFGRFILFASVAGFILRQGDRAVLGKFVSLDDIAFYNIAFFLATVPLLIASSLNRNVFYPLYARRPPGASERNRQKIAKARRLISAVLICAVLFIGLIGVSLVTLLYDDRYAPSGPLLVLITIGSLPLIIVETYVNLPLAAGHSGRFAIFQVSHALTQIGLLVLVVPIWGLLGAVVVPGLAILAVYPLLLWTIRPYDAWDPVHDAVFAGMSTLFGGIVLWFNWASLEPLFAAI